VCVCVIEHVCVSLTDVVEPPIYNIIVSVNSRDSLICAVVERRCTGNTPQHTVGLWVCVCVCVCVSGVSASCRNRCYEPLDADSPSCRCDGQCVDAGSCCHDYRDICLLPSEWPSHTDAAVHCVCYLYTALHTLLLWLLISETDNPGLVILILVFHCMVVGLFMYVLFYWTALCVHFFWILKCSINKSCCCRVIRHSIIL